MENENKKSTSLKNSWTRIKEERDYYILLAQDKQRELRENERAANNHFKYVDKLERLLNNQNQFIGASTEALNVQSTLIEGIYHTMDMILKIKKEIK